MMEELARHGYSVGPGTLYPLRLSWRRRVTWTSSTEVVKARKQRKYYRATSEGAQALENAKVKLRELVKEVLHDDPPTPSIRSKRAKGQN